MVATLSHNPSPAVDNFYQHSFKQLSAVQQKQVGLLVGTAVADAAARSLDGYSAEEVASLEEEAKNCHASHQRLRAIEKDEDVVVFSNAPLRGHTALSPSEEERLRRTRGRNPLHYHSFSYRLYHHLVNTMASARGDFPLNYVQEAWVREATCVHAGVFAAEHSSLLHTLISLLPLPTLYPYTDDATLRSYADQFITFLTEPPVGASSGAHSSTVASDAATAPLAQAERTAVRDFTHSALGVALRCLQSNPDPVRNAAFMAVKDTASIFPTDVAMFCPVGSGRQVNEEVYRLYHSSDSTRAAFPARPVLHDAQTVRQGLLIAREATTFAEGIRRAIRLGGPTCQRAALVGALLGARLGARSIPSEWLSATPDHKVVSTMSLEIAQWSWNPPHH